MIKRSYLCGGSLLAVTIALGLSAPAFAQSNTKAAPAPTDVEEVVVTGSYIAGTPEDCIGQLRAAEGAGATQLMFTVSLAADPVATVELFGREVLPALTRCD